MTQQNRNDSPTGRAASSGPPGSGSDDGHRPMAGLANDAREVGDDLLSDAQAFAGDKAEDLQGAAAGHFRTFADAVRTAGKELGDKEPGQVSAFVCKAAEGLESFSDALGRKSPREMINTVRDFGRENPVGFLAGSMLVGFALARFAGSTAPTGTGASAQKPRPAPRADARPRPPSGPDARTGYGQSPRPVGTAGGEPAQGARLTNGPEVPPQGGPTVEPWGPGR